MIEAAGRTEHPEGAHKMETKKNQWWRPPTEKKKKERKPLQKRVKKISVVNLNYIREMTHQAREQLVSTPEREKKKI